MFTFQVEQGSTTILDPCFFIGKIQVTFRKCVLYPDKIIFEVSSLKVGIRSLGWDHRGLTPTSVPNIYITWSVKRTGKICGRHNKRSQIICGAVHNVLSSSLHYSTQRSCLQTVLIASPVVWSDAVKTVWECLDIVNIAFLAYVETKAWTVSPLDWSNQNSLPAGLLGGVLQGAGQHHIQFWTACPAGRKVCRSAWRLMWILGSLFRVTAAMVPSQGF